MRFSRTAQSALAILVLLGVGLPVWTLWIAREEPPATAPRPERGPVPVAVERVQAVDLALGVMGHGLLHPARRVALTPEVSGRVVEVWSDWRRGAAVAAGQELLRVDPRPYEIQRDLAAAHLREAGAAARRAAVEVRLAGEREDRAREELALARREVERFAGLAGPAAVPESTRDAAERARVAAEGALREAGSALEAARVAEESAAASVEAARARLDDAQDRLQRCRLVAPFAGRLAGRPPARGAAVGPGTVLGELLDLSHLELVVHVPEERIRGVRLGDRAEVAVEALPGERLEGTVAALGALADPATLSVPVEVDVRVDAERALGVAGLSARARLSTGRVADAVWIDRRSFLWRGGEAVAHVLVDGRAQRRALELGEPHGEGFRVRGGLAPGELLITHPVDRVADGDEVVLRPAGGDAP